MILWKFYRPPTEVGTPYCDVLWLCFLPMKIMCAIAFCCDNLRLLWCGLCKALSFIVHTGIFRRILLMIWNLQKSWLHHRNGTWGASIVPSKNLWICLQTLIPIAIRSLLFLARVTISLRRVQWCSSRFPVKLFLVTWCTLNQSMSKTF